VYLLSLLLFCLSVWPVNFLLFQSKGRELRDERQEMIDENTYRKEKHRREQEEDDIEQRQQILKD